VGKGVENFLKKWVLGMKLSALLIENAWKRLKNT
jgi:hypothetical protein